MAISTEQFNGLDQAAQVAALEKLGRVALAEFGIEPTEIQPLVHAENTTFRVDSASGRFSLRISRPAYQTTENIRSEIALLTALRAEEFRVPAPWQDRLVSASHPEVPEARDCVLFRWMDGNFRSTEQPVTTTDARRLGETIARLHRFTSEWRLPPGFERQQIHAKEFSSSVTRLIDEPHPMVTEADRALLVDVQDRYTAWLQSLPRNAATFGLIHADLHRGNVLFEGDQVNLIDFDDTGWAFWIYDFGAALTYESRRDEYPSIRDAMLDGYSSVRPLPPDTEALLPRFIEGRFASIAQWVLSRSDNPNFREEGPAFIASLCDGIRGVRALRH